MNNPTQTLTLDEYVALPYTTFVTSSTCDGQTCFVAYHRELEGCMAQGATWEDAVKNLNDARRDYIAALLKRGWTVPLPAFQPQPYGLSPITPSVMPIAAVATT